MSAHKNPGNVEFYLEGAHDYWDDSFESHQ